MANVLIVDDDPGTCETYGAAFRHASYGVRLAYSGAGAIAALSSGVKTQVLLLDLKLGDMSGYDVLRWMRSRSVCVPTAVMTAFRAEFDPDEAIALGAYAYADQPLSIDDILTLAEWMTAPPSPHDDPVHLHARVLAGQPGALNCLAGVFLQRLPPRLQRAFPRVPWDFTFDAVTDACLEYAGNPARFDPSLSASIVDFLYLIARRNLADRVRAEIALKNRELRYAGEQMVTLLPERQAGRSAIDLSASLLAVTIDSLERRAVQLWLDDAANDAIAAALGYAQVDHEKQRREVKRFKDRLLKRLSRYFRRLSEDA